MPLYPMIDDRPTESSKDNDAPLWNTYNNRSAWKLYLGKLFEKGDTPYYAAPARATDLTNLPPTITYVGDLDPFLSETVTYAENLGKAGVPAEYRVYKGCFHGFDVLYPDAKVSKEALDWFHSSVAKAADTYFKPQGKSS